MKKIIVLFLLLKLLCSAYAFAPTKQQSVPVETTGLAYPGVPDREIGRPFIRNYSPKEFGAAPQNFAIAQDQRGVMYFGNAEGLLEYDGVSWRRITTPNRTVVRSLAMAPNGRIYAGEVGAFGYLAPDSMGQMRFVSLLENVPEEERKFTDVWSTCVTSHGVYFSTYTTLFRWAENRIEIWKPQSQFQFAFALRDTLYVDQKDHGLMRLVGDSLALVRGSEIFATSRIRVLLPFDDGRILIGTLEQGLYLYDGVRFQPFPTSVDSFLQQNQLYKGLALPNGTFALATIRGGVVIIDQSGHLLQRVDKAAGIQDNFVLAMYADLQGSMWLALFNGITHVETPAPLSLFGEGAGLKGHVTALTRHQGMLYVATALGVFYLEPTLEEAVAFKPVAGIAAQCWSFLSLGQDLLVATNGGVYRISKTKISNLGYSGALTLHRSQQDGNRIFVGLIMGLGSLQWSHGKWLATGKIPGIEEEVRSIAETENGILWLGTKAQGILRVTLPDDGSLPMTPQVEHFNSSHGLPEGELHVYILGKRLFFTSHQGVFRFDDTGQRFLPDSTFGGAFATGKAGVEVLDKDQHGNVWLAATYEAGDEANLLLRQPDDSFQRLRTPFLRIPKTDLYAIYADDESSQHTGDVVWYGGAEGLVRYDRNVPKNYAAPFTALIRRVIVNTDSTIFAGTETSTGVSSSLPSLSYQSKSLRFEFSATSFEAQEENLFQTYLEGFDKNWSPWTKDAKKDYTNLSTGPYRFHVRAKNIYEQESRATTYAFKMLPPWHRTPWAYGGYAVLFGLLVYASDRVQRRRLLKKERERAVIRETKLRAQTVEAENKALHAENERKKNVELLSEIGKEITASLDMDTIFHKLYAHVNQLADATVFGIGIYHEEKEQIEYRLAVERGKRYAPYTRDTRNKNQFPVWCIENRQPVFINDVAKEYCRYIQDFASANVEGMKLEDGTLPEEPVSLIYLPLISQDTVLGVITIQSLQKNAYTDHHLNLLQSLAAYTTIALDNADAYRRLDETLQNLKSAQQQLATQEKLASLGQLTAGIAHEIKNPLNFVNNFAALSVDLAKELREEVAKLEDHGATSIDRESLANVIELLESLIQNAQKINEHGKRADNIVKNMMQHARGSSAQQREQANVNRLLDEAVNSTFHEMKEQDVSFNVRIEKEYDETIGKISVVLRDVGRAFSSIINNACYAAHLKAQEDELERGRPADGVREGEGEIETPTQAYTPTLSLRTKNLDDRVEVRIRDNGSGIPKEIRERIFTPFFTTKPTGQGTGLGLSISYDIIVQQHRGDIKVETEEGKFTEFVVQLPKNS